jgi:DNA polymerase
MAQDKETRMAALAQEVRDLEESPLYEERVARGYEPVVGEGDLDAALMFVGEAPGRQEAESGRPFVGRAGQVLDALLEELGVDRGDVYITNVVKDRPPQNRDPRVGEIACYAPFLRRQIEIIRPRVIATLGRFAAHFVLETFDRPEAERKMGDLHGRVFEARAAYGPVALVPLYHPAASFYNRQLEDVLHEDFQVLAQFLDAD